MWAKYKYFILAGVAFIAIGVLQSMAPQKTVWLESYSKFDKIPYGDFVLYEELGNIFTKSYTPSFASLRTSLDDSLSNTNLLVINNTFDADKSEIDALLAFVQRGNQAMIISRKMSDDLLDTLGLSTDTEFIGNTETGSGNRLAGDSVTYSGPAFNILFQTYFDTLANAQPLGYRSDSLVNFIQVKYGAGNLYLHLMPSAFTNAFMLTGQNNAYVSKVLSHLPDQNTIWDEYYKARKHYVVQTPLQQVLTTEGLRQALYLAVLGTLIYMLFASKRRQRIIPVLPPKTNATLEFIETMSHLYYNESDHKDIGLKRENYFLADIRERYRIETEALDSHFIYKLSTLSGVAKMEIEKLVDSFNSIRRSQKVQSIQIIEQDKLVESFYRKERSYGK